MLAKSRRVGHGVEGEVCPVSRRVEEAQEPRLGENKQVTEDSFLMNHQDEAIQKSFRSMRNLSVAIYRLTNALNGQKYGDRKILVSGPTAHVHVLVLGNFCRVHIG